MARLEGQKSNKMVLIAGAGIVALVGLGLYFAFRPATQPPGLSPDTVGNSTKQAPVAEQGSQAGANTVSTPSTPAGASSTPAPPSNPSNTSNAGTPASTPSASATAKANAPGTSPTAAPSATPLANAPASVPTPAPIPNNAQPTPAPTAASASVGATPPAGTGVTPRATLSGPVTQRPLPGMAPPPPEKVVPVAPSNTDY